MEDMFKNAKFGDKFKTRDNTEAVYINSIKYDDISLPVHFLVLNNNENIFIPYYGGSGAYNSYGENPKDIVLKC